MLGSDAPRQAQEDRDVSDITIESVATALGCIEALDRRYAQGQPGTAGEQWITLREARSGAGLQGNNRQCDFLAINTWHSKGLQVIGHEIKVSRADWRKELEQPEKAESFARYCRRWFVVAPYKLASQIQHEVPPAWGLLGVQPNRTVELIPAPARQPEQIPDSWWIGWMAQLDRKEKRDNQARVQREVSAAVDQARRQWEAREGRGQVRADEAAVALREKVTEFTSRTGIDINRAWAPHADKMGMLWKLAQHPLALEKLATTLRSAADDLDLALQPTLINEPKPTTGDPDE
jgi:hypothetical protein